MQINYVEIFCDANPQRALNRIKLQDEKPEKDEPIINASVIKSFLASGQIAQWKEIHTLELSSLHGKVRAH
jgi:hypothetical protein